LELTMTRIARIAAGLVLLSGAIFLAKNSIAVSRGESTLACWRVICSTWAGAAFVAFVGSLFRDRGDRHRVPGYVIPAAGVAIMLPLTLHMIVARMMDSSMWGFDAWCLWSLIFVGVAHVAFAIMVAMRAADIANGRIPMKVGTIYLATVALAGVPGVILVLPMIVTAVTGIAIVPLLHAMERWGERETLPVAVLRSAA
jgi:hypothetical protein